MTLADWIMRATTSNPPRGHEQWAEAMRAEYAVLGGGKLGWAFGCWTTMLGWRLRDDGLYFATLIAVVILLDFSTFWMWLVEVMPHSLFQVLVDQLDINLWLVLMLLGAISLNALKPGRPFLTGLTLIAMQHIGFAVDLLNSPPEFQQAFLREPYHIYNAPPFVAVFAEIGVCFCGALIGAWLSHLRGRGGVKRGMPAARP